MSQFRALIRPLAEEAERGDAAEDEGDDEQQNASKNRRRTEPRPRASQDRKQEADAEVKKAKLLKQKRQQQRQPIAEESEDPAPLTSREHKPAVPRLPANYDLGTEDMDISKNPPEEPSTLNSNEEEMLDVSYPSKPNQGPSNQFPAVNKPQDANPSFPGWVNDLVPQAAVPKPTPGGPPNVFIQRLQEELVEARQNISQRDAAIAQLQQAWKTAVSERDANTQTEAKLRELLTKNKDKLDVGQAQLDQRLEALKKAEYQLHIAESEMQKRNDVIDQMRARIKTMEDQRAAETASHAESLAKAKAMQETATKEEAKQVFVKYQVDNDRLAREVKLRDAEVHEQKQKVVQLEAKAAADLETYKGLKAQSDQNYSDLQGRNRGLANELQKTNDELVLARTNLLDVQKSLNNAQVELQSRVTQAAAQQQKIAALEEKNAQLLTANTQLHTLNQTVSGSLIRQDSELKQLRQERDQKIAEISEQRDENAGKNQRGFAFVESITSAGEKLTMQLAYAFNRRLQQLDTNPQTINAILNQMADADLETLLARTPAVDWGMPDEKDPNKRLPWLHGISVSEPLLLKPEHVEAIFKGLRVLESRYQSWIRYLVVDFKARENELLKRLGMLNAVLDASEQNGQARGGPFEQPPCGILDDIRESVDPKSVAVVRALCADRSWGYVVAELMGRHYNSRYPLADQVIVIIEKGENLGYSNLHLWLRHAVMAFADRMRLFNGIESKVPPSALNRPEQEAIWLGVLARYKQLQRSFLGPQPDVGTQTWTEVAWNAIIAKDKGNALYESIKNDPKLCRFWRYNLPHPHEVFIALCAAVAQKL